MHYTNPYLLYSNFTDFATLWDGQAEFTWVDGYIPRWLS